MRKSVILTIGLVAVLSLAACTARGGVTVITVKRASRGISTAGCEADFFYEADFLYPEYKDLPSLARDSDLIITGKVVGEEDIGPWFVYSRIRVLQLSKGNDISEVIRVWNHKGGYQLLPGETYALALVSMQPDDDAYSVTGGFQGIFHQHKHALEVTKYTYVTEIKQWGACGNTINAYSLANWLGGF